MLIGCGIADDVAGIYVATPSPGAVEFRLDLRKDNSFLLHISGPSDSDSVKGTWEKRDDLIFITGTLTVKKQSGNLNWEFRKDGRDLIDMETTYRFKREE